MMDDPNSIDPQGNMNPDMNGQNNPSQTDTKLSEDDSRRLILESYEKAGVDLPLVTLETILDREIVEDDARQTGAPRFKKFLTKASAMANRANKNGEFEEGPDDEIDELGADELSLPSAASYTSNVIPDPPPLETSQVETPHVEPEPVPVLAPVPVPAPVPAPVEPEVAAAFPQTPERTEMPNATADGAALIPPTPEAMKNDCAATFDFCCPQKQEASPAKYVVSNLQLPEGFEDEQQSAEVQDVPALMDNEESMVDEISFKTENQAEKQAENQGPSVSKENTGTLGFLSFFRGSRRFRFAVLFCCLLHVILIGLIIAFVTSRDNEAYQAGSASASIPTATIPPTEAEFVTATTLSPDPDLDNLIDEAMSNTTNTTIIEDEEVPVVAIGDNSTDLCVDSLEVDVTCFDEDTELFVHFVSCAPQVGDWVALFDSSADAQALVLTEAIGWMYTCGDRFCEEAVQEQTLSFSRAKDKAEHEGTYKAYLIREGEGPTFSPIASSPEFRILTDATSSC